MLEEIPYIDDLMKVLEDDHHWNEFKQIKDEIFLMHERCVSDLFQKISWSNPLQDYKYYLFNFLVRSGRISSSIFLLLLYERLSEANMLNRPFLENIVETIIFFKQKRRGRLMRQIRLYWLLNEKLRVDFYAEQTKMFYKNSFVTKYMKEHDELLESNVTEGLKEFAQEEINKMEEQIMQGCSWVGLNPKGSFKESGLYSKFDNYRMACTLLHIREQNAAYELKMKEKELYVKFEFCTTLEGLIIQLKCYEKICNDIFLKNDFSERIIKIENQLKLVMYNIMDKIDPDWQIFVPLREDK